MIDANAVAVIGVNFGAQGNVPRIILLGVCACP